MFSLDFFESIIGKKRGLGDKEALGFSIDSKKVQEGNCFIGLKGEKVDGSSFFKEAILRGAIGLILSEDFISDFKEIEDSQHDVWVFFVKDTKQILFELAKAWRKKYDIPSIGVTGSVGKTTTKDLLKDIFVKAGHKVCATQNSENGSCGLPMTILALRPSHTIAIFELGVEKIGEMNVLCDLLGTLSVSVITTVLESHLKYFESLDAVITEKVSIQKITKDIVCIDSHFKKYITSVPVFTFGTTENSDIMYTSLSTKVSMVDHKHDKNYSVNVLYHEGFHHCLVAAFSAALCFKIKSSIIIDAIETFKKTRGRFSVHHLKSGGIIINDAYNSVNPLVMIKSIQAFLAFPTYKKKIIVLGDMFDLGTLSEVGHKMVIDYVNQFTKDMIEKYFFCGSRFSFYKEQCQSEHHIFLSDFEFAEDAIYRYLDQKYCILFKGSNGTGIFKRLVSYLDREEML